MPWLFCYGSNSPRQLEERLGYRPEVLEPAYYPNHQRVFRGWSRNWGGGVASMIRKANHRVYGYVAWVEKDDLAILDRYEGVGSGNYRRRNIKVIAYGLPPMGGRWGQDVDDKTPAIAYVSTSSEFNEPTRKYLKAIAKTISEFWDDGDDPVEWFDIPVR